MPIRTMSVCAMLALSDIMVYQLVQQFDSLVACSTGTGQ